MEASGTSASFVDTAMPTVRNPLAVPSDSLLTMNVTAITAAKKSAAAGSVTMVNPALTVPSGKSRILTSSNPVFSSSSSSLSSSSSALVSRSLVVAAATAIVDTPGSVQLSRKRSLCEISSTAFNNSQQQQQRQAMISSKPVVRILSAPTAQMMTSSSLLLSRPTVSAPHMLAATKSKKRGNVVSTKSNATFGSTATTTNRKATGNQAPKKTERSPVETLMSILDQSSSSLAEEASPNNSANTDEIGSALKSPSHHHHQVIAFQDIPSDFYVPFTDAEMESYDSKMLHTIRSRDLDGLRALHKAGRPLKCSNRFGESLLHLACRKGFADVVDLLVNEAGVTLRVKDDFGRNPAHDACWTVRPNFELMDLIIMKCPDLFLVKDVRGHTPLDYVRREHWSAWTDYLQEKGMELTPKILVPSTHA